MWIVVYTNNISTYNLNRYAYSYWNNRLLDMLFYPCTTVPWHTTLYMEQQ